MYNTEDIECKFSISFGQLGVKEEIMNKFWIRTRSTSTLNHINNLFVCHNKSRIGHRAGQRMCCYLRKDVR